MIFIKCRDFAKMPCFAVFLAKMLRFCILLQEFLFLIGINWSFLCDFNVKLITFAAASKVIMSGYLIYDCWLCIFMLHSEKILQL